ncbi:unnamed protein product, partial [marine sediment metagenome]
NGEIDEFTDRSAWHHGIFSLTKGNLKPLLRKWASILIKNDFPDFQKKASKSNKETLILRYLIRELDGDMVNEWLGRYLTKKDEKKALGDSIRGSIVDEKPLLDQLEAVENFSELNESEQARCAECAGRLLYSFDMEHRKRAIMLLN